VRRGANADHRRDEEVNPSEPPPRFFVGGCGGASGEEVYAIAPGGSALGKLVSGPAGRPAAPWGARYFPQASSAFAPWRGVAGMGGRQRTSLFMTREESKQKRERRGKGRR